MTYYVLLLSVLFVAGFVGFSSKPSPIYGGLGLIVSGGVGCGIILSYGATFLGLMMFLVYLGGMLVVFGYTTAMATEEYPETWGSNVAVLGALVAGLVMELVLVGLFVGDGVVGWGLELKGSEILGLFGGEEGGYVREDSMGVASLYGSGGWFMLLAGWMLFVSIFIVIEITRGF
uniref:NADH-ubiquinone oxidoreductase chain 6 n=2 Tax=Ochotona TaxID=9977 RepID=A0A6G7SBB4_9LAGO|nr:NADH dehydrogenase subunit 6 [Ochotona koslowi]YP_011004837.1 NADH dehydrogenase subunit 6 [Ochotona gloveri]AYU56859.1 NADH dehydrogenase subunit 6 [Ochotona koslowi]QIJ99090.1 NADH dehydrogenase subunit 6 [Ochotona gloveri]QIJ99103.1 NADH dehydrogenase subunit 6 [Ochotona gloveri]QIJ99116.1 NADH dehydrogenase subunit 6 [Ochotona gloveri]WAL35467.1 NADH dehydrogenase subunit 6 [Ochotona gloveri]